jgi:rSAM/selenodomain-associated transferase 2
MATVPTPLAVVVPVLNERALIKQLAAELAALASRGCEAVIVDGGSDDGTREELARLAGRVRVVEAARGRARQMNAGARATRAPVLLFVHADTRLPPDPARAIARAIDGGAVGGCFKLRIASGDPRLRAAAGLINLRSRLLPSASGDQAIFVRRDAFERVGGFRPVELCEDLDLVARLGALGRFQLVDATVETSARRWEKNGVSRTIALMWALRIGYHLGVAPGILSRLYGHDVR